MSRQPKRVNLTCQHAAIALCVLGVSSAWADQNPTDVVITADPPIRVSGFEGVPIQVLPFSVTTISNATLRDIGAQRVTDAMRLDASVTDSYNLPAYWDKLSIRGYALDNRYNFRREGLPISAETIIPMDNKQRIDILKGTSGIQSGTSAPGGLVNYVVKRAPSDPDSLMRDLTVSYGTGDNRRVAADLGGRFGQEAELGYRLNVAHEDLNPYIRDTQGQRDLVALAMDWRINSRTRLEWEFEQSHHQQMGVNFYSLLGAGTRALPAPVDGTRNITRQATSQPGVFDGLTGSIGLTHLLNNGWSWHTQYGIQRLRADDRLTYASGCPSPPTDRFCANGDFQIHDYRSDNEHRNSEVIQTDLRGQMQIGGVEHGMSLSLMRQRQLIQMPYTYTDNLLGVTNINGGFTATPINNTYLQSHSSDYNTEIALNDRIRFTENTHAWLGLRHTQLNRQSSKTDGSQAVTDTRGMRTPWLALSQQLSPHHWVYVSYGQGLEAEVVPNTSTYANAAQPLPALRSTQRELGIKSQAGRHTWQATWFDITRPATTDAGSCNNLMTGSCTRQIDGQNHHRGVELGAQTSMTPWRLGGSAMWLDAQRENATLQSNLNGQRPINVPSYILRGMAEYNFANMAGLRSGLRVSQEGKRHVTENGDIVLPAWTTLDATTHYDTQHNGMASTWTLAINNLANKRYWRESPRQYAQYFLYPGAPRTVRASVQFHL